MWRSDSDRLSVILTIKETPDNVRLTLGDLASEFRKHEAEGSLKWVFGKLIC